MTDRLKDIIVQNKDQFDTEVPGEGHEKKFLWKLHERFTHFISIVPYLIWVLIFTIIVNIIGIVVWNNFIRKDRHEITLKEKITNITNKIL